MERSFKFYKSKLENKTFGGLVGQFVDLETSYAFKKLFKNVLIWIS